MDEIKPKTGQYRVCTSCDRPINPLTGECRCSS